MKELESYFGKTLFCEDDIDYVRKQVNENAVVLYGQDCSLNNTDKIYELEKKIEALNSTEVSDLFNEYENLLQESIEQQNCLAYYLGLRKGLEMRKI